MSIMAILSILLIFYFSREYLGILLSYISYVMIISNDYFVLQLSRAMSESPLLFFIILVMLLLVILAKLLLTLDQSVFKNYKKLTKLIIYSILIGFITGLAGATKLNGFSLFGVSIFLLVILNIFLKLH